jgi:hypothetical protein
MRAYFLILVAAFAASCSNSEMYQIQVRVESDERLSSAELEERGWLDSPCDYTKFVETKRLPSAGRSVIPGTERAIELDTNGSEVTRWALPTDVIPIGVRSGWLLVSQGTSVLAIHESGDLALDDAISPEIGPNVACSEAMEKFTGHVPGIGPGNSACWIFDDSESGEKRRIMFPLPCT